MVVEDSARTGRRRTVLWVCALVAAAVLGGLVGGALVRARDASPASASGACPATAVAAMGLPSVVTIIAQAPGGGPGGSGSGEVIQAGGMVLTNDHVIAVAGGGGALQVRYNDGRSAAATIVGRDPLTDLAVIKAADGAPGIPLIGRGSSRSLAIGQPVVALGAPLGLYGTVTSGIVSALDRQVTLPAAGGLTAHLVGAIQTDASINPGNSGGALVDCAARLVGVNTAIATVPNEAGQAGGGSVGLGFAVAADVALPVAQELINDGRVTHYTVGMDVHAIPPGSARLAGLPAGLVVTAVDPAGGAARGGMAPGDIITTINGEPAASAEQLTIAELGYRNAQPIAVTYLRAGRPGSATLVPTRQ